MQVSKGRQKESGRLQSAKMTCLCSHPSDSLDLYPTVKRQTPISQPGFSRCLLGRPTTNQTPVAHAPTHFSPPKKKKPLQSTGAALRATDRPPRRTFTARSPHRPASSQQPARWVRRSTGGARGAGTSTALGQRRGRLRRRRQVRAVPAGSHSPGAESRRRSPSHGAISSASITSIITSGLQCPCILLSVCKFFNCYQIV